MEEAYRLLPYIKSIDYELLKLINFDGSESYNMFWLTYSDKMTWMPLAVVCLYCLLRWGGWKHTLLMALSLAFLFTLSDFVVSAFIKELVGRLRPSHNPELMEQLNYVEGYRGGRFGFPSNHASNGFAAATFLWLVLKRKWIGLTACLWALGSCYSRMFMGVHYPTDILCGALCGTVFAFITYGLYRFAAKRLALPPDGKVYTSMDTCLIAITFFLTVLVLLAASLLVPRIAL